MMRVWRKGRVFRFLVASLCSIALAMPAAAAAAPDPHEEALFQQWLEERGEIESDAATRVRPHDQFRSYTLPSAVRDIRVGLARRDPSVALLASDFDHPRGELTATTPFRIIDVSSGDVVFSGAAEQWAFVTRGAAGFAIESAGASYGPFAGPLRLVADTVAGAAGFVRVNFPERPVVGSGRVTSGTRHYLYRGVLEMIAGAPDRLRLVNVVGLEPYMRGLAEVPTFFHAEAIKAQAIAARGYALASLGSLAHLGFDLADSVLSQAYRGVAWESAKQDEAVFGTTGLVSTYEGRIVDARYASTSGGHTENNEFVWSDGAGFPGTPVPYLRGKEDGHQSGLDLTTEAGARSFYTTLTYPHVTNGVTGNYRWTETWTSRAQLEAILNRSLADRAASDPAYVQPAFPVGSSIGTLRDLRVVGRGVSGKALALEIVGSNGTWTVRKELNIRWVLRRPNANPATAGLLRSANIVLDVTRDITGNVTSVVARGGGFGHGVGMDQWGAHARGRDLGQSAAQILRHYYTGSVVSTYPLKLRRETSVPMREAYRQEFFAPTGRATLVLENDGMTNLQLVVNGQVVNLNAARVEPGGVSRFDLSPHLTPGLNEVVYEPLGAPDAAAVVTVEVE